MILPEFDILDELKNTYVKIPLLQATKEIPIYAKTIKELCIKKTGKKKKDPTTIQAIGKLASLMSKQTMVEKYIDPGIPMVTISIKSFFSSKHIDRFGSQYKCNDYRDNVTFGFKQH